MNLEIPDWLDKAERAWLSGNDAAAERLLLLGFRAALVAADARLEAVVTLAFARYAVHLDEDRTAATLAELGEHGSPGDEELKALGTLVRWTTAVPAVSRAKVAGLRARVEAAAEACAGGEIAAWGAVASLALGMPDEAHAWLVFGEQRRTGGPSQLLRMQVEGELAATESRFDDAAKLMHEAMELARSEGWRRAHARLELRFGAVVAPHLTDVSPMSWISRSAPDLLQMGTWRDRNTLRHALRTHGRRMADRALSELAAEPLDRLNQAVGSLRLDALLTIRTILGVRGAEHAATQQWEREVGHYVALLDRLRQLAEEVTEVEANLGELVGEALVERDRTALMVSALAELDGVSEPTELATAGARIAAEFVEAAQVWVTERDAGGGLRVIGSHPPGQNAPDAGWVHLLDEASASKFRGGERLPRRRPSLGSRIAVPVEAPPFSGALLLDKGHPQRRFREDDRVLATLLGVELAHGLARIRSRAAEMMAHTRLAATFEAIRDGVVAVDAQGRVRNANAAAARMLRMHGKPLVGARLSELDYLKPLWAVLSSSPRVDSTVVRLSHGTMVVTSRPVGKPAKGMVATLVELGRAEQMARQITAARPRFTFDDIVGDAEVMREAIRLARLAAEVDANLLITGESGTGKEMFAQALHMAGARAHQPFVGINCAALPRDLLEAELFGYERGAFTGARQSGQLGKFELVGEGTLLLDEIGDMPPDMQAKLLRVLQERVVVRLGGTQERRVHARIISSTHRNLEEAVGRSAFRLDLLFRLRVLHVHIPPLRDRPGDIAALAVHFLRRTAKSMRKEARSIAPGAIEQLERHDWPGNVRELANVIEREVTLLPAQATSLDRLQGELAAKWPVEEAPSVRSWSVLPQQSEPRAEPLEVLVPSARSSAVAKSMADVEREAFLDALDRHGGSVPAAAKSLGVSRSKFYAKLKAWREEGLAPPSRRGS